MVKCLLWSEEPRLIAFDHFFEFGIAEFQAMFRVKKGTGMPIIGIYLYACTGL
jgi:hypothetical protein